MGLKWDDLLMEEREDVQKVSRTRLSRSKVDVAFHMGKSILPSCSCTDTSEPLSIVNVIHDRPSPVYLSESSTIVLSESGPPCSSPSYTRVFPRTSGLLLNRCV